MAAITIYAIVTIFKPLILIADYQGLTFTTELFFILSE